MLRYPYLQIGISIILFIFGILSLTKGVGRAPKIFGVFVLLLVGFLLYETGKG
jgi:hypothetical protein